MIPVPVHMRMPLRYSEEFETPENYIRVLNSVTMVTRCGDVLSAPTSRDVSAGRGRASEYPASEVVMARVHSQPSKPNVRDA